MSQVPKSSRSPLARALSVASSAVNAGDAAFVRLGSRLEYGLLKTTGGAVNITVAALPRIMERTAEVLGAVAAGSERLAAGRNSVLLDSIPAASERTMRVLRRFSGSDHAKQALQNAFAGQLPRRLLIEARYREIGRLVALCAREGLDAIPLSRAIEVHLSELRTLQQHAIAAGEAPSSTAALVAQQRTGESA